MPTNKVEQIPYGERITLRPDPLPERSTFDAGRIPREESNVKLSLRAYFLQGFSYSKVSPGFPLISVKDS